MVVAGAAATSARISSALSGSGCEPLPGQLVADRRDAQPRDGRGRGAGEEPQRDEDDGPAHLDILARRHLGGTQAVPKAGLRRAEPARLAESVVVSSAAMASVLVVEDDQRIREALARSLVDNGHAVRTEARGTDALGAVVDWKPDVVVLDLGLPDLDGSDVLRMLRGVSTVPVIVATARDDDTEVVRLLDAGADDYIVKPYSAAQLDARIRAVLRRAGDGGGGGVREVLSVGDLEVDPERRTATLAGEPLDLSRLEFDLLAHLARRSPEVVTRRELLAEVWRQPHGGADKTIDVHLSWLRRKLGESATEPRYLHTVRGVGIKLEPPGA